MLDKCGIRGYAKLYISGEIGLYKGHSGLFNYVLDDLSITPHSLHHIGDNRRADFAWPLFMGIKVTHIHNNWKKLSKPPKGMPKDALLSYRTLQACIENCARSGMDEYAKQGCCALGPILVGYAFWLLRKLREDGVRDVYFMSRDGWMLQCAFELLGANDIRTHYLYGSRRAYVIPLLWKHIDFEDMYSWVAYDPKIVMTVRWFLGHIGLDPHDYESLAMRHGLDIDRVYAHGTFTTDAAVRSFFKNIEDDIFENSIEEYRALLAYLKGFDLAGRIGFADSGYSGRSQLALQELFQIADMDVSINGYYFPMNPESRFMRGGVSQRSWIYEQCKR